MKKKNLHKNSCASKYCLACGGGLKIWDLKLDLSSRLYSWSKRTNLNHLQHNISVGSGYHQSYPSPLISFILEVWIPPQNCSKPFTDTVSPKLVLMEFLTDYSFLSFHAAKCQEKLVPYFTSWHMNTGSLISQSSLWNMFLPSEKHLI